MLPLLTRHVRDEAEALYNALVEADAVNAKTWNGGISKEQFAWLKSELDAAQAAGRAGCYFQPLPRCS